MCECLSQCVLTATIDYQVWCCSRLKMSAFKRIQTFHLTSVRNQTFSNQNSLLGSGFGQANRNGRIKSYDVVI